MCHRTSVCGPAGDAAAYDFAAKNFRWAKKSLSGFSTFLFAFILFFCFFCFFTRIPFSCRRTLLVGLSHGGLALHPWNELWLFTRRGAGAKPSFRYGAPRVSGPTLGSSGRPADCFQPLALSGPLLLLGVVDRRLPLLHLTFWPFLPPVSHGSIASAAERWETGPLQLNGVLCLSRNGWLGGPAGLLMTLPLLHNDCFYHQSSWFSLQCFLNWWLVFTTLIPRFFIWWRNFMGRRNVVQCHRCTVVILRKRSTLLCEMWNNVKLDSVDVPILVFGTANVSSIIWFIRITRRWFLQLHVCHLSLSYCPSPGFFHFQFFNLKRLAFTLHDKIHAISWKG